MSAARGTFRWALMLVALALGLVALLVSVARLTLGQVERLEPRLEALLAERLGAEVSVGELRGDMQGLDPSLSLRDLHVNSARPGDELALLDIEEANFRLDVSASLAQGLPVLSQARVSGVTLHLYQAADLSWYWPGSKAIDAMLKTDGDLDLAHLDAWTAGMLHQRLWGDDLRLVLHGRERTLKLQVPRLLISGDKRGAHLEGSVELVEESVELVDAPDKAFQVVMDVLPGRHGLGDFGAALQADMDLESLAALLRVLGLEEVVRLDDLSGSAQLWARWTAGRLEDVRLDLEVPRLALSQPPTVRDEDERTLVLKEASLKGQWLRDDDDWEAWLVGEASDEGEAGGSDDAQQDDGQGDSPGEGLPVPRYWHATSRDNGWWLNASAFELDALAAWYDRLPLPEALSRTLATLAPRGRVDALGVGYLDEQWQARVSATQVAVSPWEDAPGGGPLDIWLEAKGNRGDVRFIHSADNSTDSAAGVRLEFPQLFDAPLALDHASGRVHWIYDGPRSSVSGLDLEARMNGASVAGSFGLVVGGEGRGGFGLRLTMADVDAVGQPLTGWLPMKLLREEVAPALAEWLASGVAGRVPEGQLTLHLPLGAEGSHDQDTLESLFGLDLTVSDARLPFAPDWPLIESIEGRLSLLNETLDARVSSAQSLGVALTAGEAHLVDNVLSVTADLSASPSAVGRYLSAMPVEGMALAEDWQGEGRVDGQLSLSLPMDNLDALTLNLETQAAVERLVHGPSGLTLHSLSGPLRWYQQGDSGGLQGQLEARLLGGPVKADIDTQEDRLRVSGRLAVSELLAMGMPDGANKVVSGQLPWQASVELTDSPPTVLIESGLEGVAIDLPTPLGKAEQATRPLSLSLALADEPNLTGRLGTALGLRWRAGGGGQGQVWLGREAPSAWPREAGWSVSAYLPELVLPEWGQALAPLVESPSGTSGGVGLRHLAFDTDCLRVSAHCLGSLAIDGQPQGAGWQLALDGSLLTGQLSYRPGADMELDASLSQLVLDGLIPEAEQSGQGTLLGEVYVPPEPEAMPVWLGSIPDGRLRVAELHRKGRRFGPLTAYWAATPTSLAVSPVGLTLGEISAHGSLVWEAAGAQASLTRARGALNGRNLGNALSLLGEQVPVTSANTQVTTQLAWPGAPWQFALARSRGSIEAELRDGRFVNLESPSARVVGLLNVDNLLRRLSLDFSDVTGRGTAFDRVSGAATLYGGVLETRGPINIEGPATNFALDGSVDLIRRQLDQQLTITVPLSSNLPLAAVMVGAPVVGGALFVADKLLGDTIDRVTQLNYRVRGPWTSPQLSLERAE